LCADRENREEGGGEVRPQDIKIGEYYRHRNTPDYCYAKALKILKPGQGINNLKYIVVKCEWTVYKDDTGYGFIKYFRPCDLIKEAGK
jgi:hypothetical protein